MRTTASFTLAAAIVSWTADASAGPLREAIMAEGIKLAVAQTVADDDIGWHRVQQLRAGQDVVVWLRQGMPLRAKVVRADGSSVRVNDTSGSHLIARSDISVIRMAHGRGSPVGAAIGAAAGGLLGLAFVSRIDFSECNCAGGPSSTV